MKMRQANVRTRILGVLFTYLTDLRKGSAAAPLKDGIHEFDLEG